MNKICLMVNNIEEFKCNADSFIIGLKNYNNLNILELDINEITNIKCNKEIIISINKIIHNIELEELEYILKKLEGYKILFDDLAVYQIVKDNCLDIQLIWGNIHATTSYNSTNSYYDLGVKSSFLSTDITLSEIYDIKNNTKATLYVPIYGKFNIFSSNRYLISAYFKYINKEKKYNKYKIKNKDILYDIYEDNNGTQIIDGKIINGIIDYKNILDNNIDYIVINSYDIDFNIFDLINSLIVIRTLYYDNLLDLKMLVNYHNKFTSINTYSGFLHKKTIYKVGDENE